MAGDVDFLRELETFLEGLDWVQVKYARIAAVGAVDLGVITDERARLHVDLVARFGAGRVNIAAQTPEVGFDEGGRPGPPWVRPGPGELVELLADGWSVDESGRWLTLYFLAGGSTSIPYVELGETSSAVELRLFTLPMPDHAVIASAWPGEVRIELAAPIGLREVLHAGGFHHPSRYRMDGDDVIDQNTGRRVYRRRSSRASFGEAPTRPLSS